MSWLVNKISSWFGGDDEENAAPPPAAEEDAVLSPDEIARRRVAKMKAQAEAAAREAAASAAPASAASAPAAGPVARAPAASSGTAAATPAMSGDGHVSVKHAPTTSAPAAAAAVPRVPSAVAAPADSTPTVKQATAAAAASAATPVPVKPAAAPIVTAPAPSKPASDADAAAAAAAPAVAAQPAASATATPHTPAKPTAAAPVAATTKPTAAAAAPAAPAPAVPALPLETQVLCSVLGLPPRIRLPDASASDDHVALTLDTLGEVLDARLGTGTAAPLLLTPSAPLPPHPSGWGLSLASLVAPQALCQCLSGVDYLCHVYNKAEEVAAQTTREHETATAKAKAKSAAASGGAAGAAAAATTAVSDAVAATAAAAAAAVAVRDALRRQCPLLIATLLATPQGELYPRAGRLLTPPHQLHALLVAHEPAYKALATARTVPASAPPAADLRPTPGVSPLQATAACTRGELQTAYAAMQLPGDLMPVDSHASVALWALVAARTGDWYASGQSFPPSAYTTSGSSGGGGGDRAWLPLGPCTGPVALASGSPLLAVPGQLLDDVASALEALEEPAAATGSPAATGAVPVAASSTLAIITFPTILRVHRLLQTTSEPSASYLLSAERLAAMRMLSSVARCRPLARALVSHPAFTGPIRPGTAITPQLLATMPVDAAASMERSTILGLLLSPSTLPAYNTPMAAAAIAYQGGRPLLPSPFVQAHFSGIRRRPLARIRESIASLQSGLETLHTGALEVIKALLKADEGAPYVTAAAARAGGLARSPSVGASPASTAAAGGRDGSAGPRPARDAVMHWFRTVLSLNAPREKDVPPLATLASDGFFVNLSAVLCELVNPIWTAPGVQRLMAQPAALASSDDGDVWGAASGDRVASINLAFLASGSPVLDGSPFNQRPPGTTPVSGASRALMPVPTASDPVSGRPTYALRTEMLVAAPEAAAAAGDGTGAAAGASAAAAPASSSLLTAEEEEDLYDLPKTAAAAASTAASAAAATGGAAATDDEGATFNLQTRMFFYALRALQLGLARVLRDRHDEEKMLSQLHAMMMRQGVAPGGDDADDEDGGAGAAGGGPFAGARARFNMVLEYLIASDVTRANDAMLKRVAVFCALASEVMGRACGGAAGRGGLGHVVAPFPPTPAVAARLLPASAVSTLVSCVHFMASARDPTTQQPCSKALILLLTDDRGPTGAATGSSASAPHTSGLATILSFFVALLASPLAYIRSPHLRAEVGDCLYDAFLPEVAQTTHGQSLEAAADDEAAGDGAALLAAAHRDAMGVSTGAMACSLLQSPSPFIARHLAPALMALYGDVEATGYYDKVEHRHKVASLLLYVAAVPAHKPSFYTITGAARSVAADAGDHDGADAGASAAAAAAGDAGDGRFVQFANGLIGHTTEALEAGLAGLPKVKALQTLLADAEQAAALTEEQRKDKERELNEAVGSARNGFTLANQTTALLALLTRDERICEQLLQTALLGRLTMMLLKCLITLTGPRSLELKVADPQRYAFKPRQLLRDICSAVLHLARHRAFIDAVIDTGMYTDDKFNRIVSIVEKHRLLDVAGAAADAAAAGTAAAAIGGSGTASSLASPGGSAVVSAASLRHFVSLCHDAQAAAEEDDALYEDPPEELCDPLMGTLMEDPVVNTVSGRIYDRSTMEQQLLTNPTDPYTRKPFTAADLQPAAEIMARITEWKAERRRAAAEAAVAARAGSA